MNTWLKSARYAIFGIRYILKHERNARIHLVFAVAMLVIGALFRLSLVEFTVILVAILFVFLAEIINSAFEKTLDIVSPGHHPTVMLIKDMAAAAVLVAAAGAAIIGVLVLAPHLKALL